MGKKVGIDLGTTYSCVAYLNDNGGLEVVKNMDGNNTTPSVVFFDPDGKTVVVGEQARAGAIMAPENIVERIKSQMEKKDYTINVCGTEYSPTAVSSIILRKLKEDAENYLGDTIDGCVITCPAYFGTIAKSATLEAAKGAGLNVYSIINEPTAAAFAYAYIKNEDINKTVMIYDLGGGTFDCTLMKMDFSGDSKHLNVIASNGDPFLGGKDWDNELRNYVVEQFCNATGTDIDTMTADPECMTELSEVIEKTKKQLTARETVKVPVSYGGEKQIIEVTRDTFDSLTESLLQKTVSLVNAMLSKENLTIDVVDEIILVGGSTYMPQVTKCLEATYGKPLFSFEPNEAVAKGAALMAAFSYDLGQDGSEQVASANPADPADPTAPQPQGDEKGFSIIDKSGKTIVVEDIINKSYGVKVYDPSQNKYFISNILIAGTAKPCSGKLDNIVTGGATHITVCETDEKDSIVEYDEAFDVYSGPLNFPAGLPGDTPAEVHFNLDMSGILSIKVLAADTETDLVFDPTTGGATKEGLETAQKLQLGC